MAGNENRMPSPYSPINKDIVFHIFLPIKFISWLLTVSLCSFCAHGLLVQNSDGAPDA
jgi:hypothetical protein